MNEGADWDPLSSGRNRIYTDPWTGREHPGVYTNDSGSIFGDVKFRKNGQMLLPGWEETESGEIRRIDYSKGDAESTTPLEPTAPKPTAPPPVTGANGNAIKPPEPTANTGAMAGLTNAMYEGGQAPQAPQAPQALRAPNRRHEALQGMGSRNTSQAMAGLSKTGLLY